jgi:Fe-S cluster biogenesis protein NfuA
MPAPSNLRSTGDRIEVLLDQLQATADSRAVALAEELLQLVSELYGAGLARAVELARSLSPPVVEAFASDDLVASLLVVHGLHPETLDRRIERALEKVRPFLSSHAGDVELIAIDSEAGALKLRLLGSCDGCPSSAVTLQMAVERAIAEAAPEIVRIDVDEPSQAPVSVPISLGVKPPIFDACPIEVATV